jgi:hypothetical protein
VGRAAVTEPSVPARQLVAPAAGEARNLAEMGDLDPVRALIAEGTARAYRP